MAFVENNEANVIKQSRFITQREVKFFGRRYDYVAVAQNILIDSTDADAAVETRNRFPQRLESSLQHEFRLRGCEIFKYFFATNPRDFLPAKSLSK